MGIRYNPLLGFKVFNPGPIGLPLRPDKKSEGVVLSFSETQVQGRSPGNVRETVISRRWFIVGRNERVK